ncbi:MAG: hypothetical protein HYV40_00195 [Candidatus Levybacteria bacterium]|nr:hypothetical protein [Candidatus Levybacteria bacterium]
MILLIRRYKRSRLNEAQLQQLSDYAKDLSLFFFGTFLAPAFARVDTIDLFMLGLGLIAGVLAFLLSLLLLKGVS